MSNANKAPVLIAISVGLMGLGMTSAIFLASGQTEVSSPTASAKQAAPVTPVAAPPTVMPPTPSPAIPTPQTEPHDPKPTQADRLASDLEREQIWKALGRKHALKAAVPGSAAPSESAAARLPELDKEYVRGAIKEQLVPVAIDCYDAALTKNPELAGDLEFAFTIIGDEEVGGVVEEVELTANSTLDDEFVRECLKESLMAVTFPPPPDGGRVEVVYPMKFEPG